MPQSCEGMKLLPPAITPSPCESYAPPVYSSDRIVEYRTSRRGSNNSGLNNPLIGATDRTPLLSRSRALSPARDPMASDTESITGGIASTLGIVIHPADDEGAPKRRGYQTLHEHQDEDEEREVNGVNGHQGDDESVASVGYGSVTSAGGRTLRGSAVNTGDQ